MDTTVFQNNEEATIERADIRMNHTDRLTRRERATAEAEAQAFVSHVKARYADDAYLHLDVKRIKETHGGLDGMKWKANLITNRGRFSAQQTGFGVFNSIHKTFEALETQLNKLH